eukprot:5782776-Pleurochrysis_carterae.AAC.1
MRRMAPQGCDDELFAHAPTYYSEFMTRYRSRMVTWVELQRDGLRGVIPVTVLDCTKNSAQAMLLRASLSMDLPEEFRQWNHRELGRAAQRRSAAEVGGSSSGPHGGTAL